jgi:Alpha/beta hydrolase of unknown function (DUF900)
MFHKKCLVFIVLSLSVLLSACAHNAIYHGELSNCISDSLGKCENYAVTHYSPNTDKEFHIGIIEFDDQGQLRDRKQMDVVLDTYSQISGSDNVLITVFVHGWQHNAAPDDSNLESFKQLLAKISHTETAASKKDKRAERKVLGVYIGWRGVSLTLPVLQHTSFWERKKTAHKVGLLGVTEVLLKLEEILQVQAATETSNPKSAKSRIAIMAHSFGAAVVYTALNQVIVERFIGRRNKKYTKNTESFGSLVILVNPAFEALRFSTIFDMSQDDCRSYKGLPRFVMLTTEADKATRYIFPFGRSLAVLFENHRDLNRHICTKDGMTKLTINEGEADRTTVGHFEPYQTHKLAPLQDKNIRKSDFNFHSLKKAWVGQSFGSQLDFEDVSLTHLGRTHPLNPYLNIYVDGSLMKNHNDIWGKEVIGFLRDLIIMATIPVSETSE